MRLTTTPFALSLLLGSCAAACESVSSLDEVEMSETGGTAGASGSTGGTVGGGAGGGAGAGGTAGEAGVDAGDGGSTDAPGDADPTTAFPASCVKAGSITIQCNPMTNEGCGADTACDMAQNGSSYGFVCFPKGTADEGQPCNGVSGPWCKPTLHCGTATCVKFCCTAADCPSATPQCTMYDPIKVGTFGWCK